MGGLNNNLDCLQTHGGNRVQLTALIGCNGAAPTLLDTNIPGSQQYGAVTVTHPATGTYQLNIPIDKLPAQIGLAMIGCDLGGNASANSNVIYDRTSLSTGVLKVYTLTAGVSADLASPYDLAISITVKNTAPARP